MLGLLLTATLVATAQDVPFDPINHPEIERCGSRPTNFCKLPANLTAAQVEEILAGKPTNYRREGDEFVVVARRDADKTFLCCAVRGRLDRVSGDLWAMRARIDDLDHAALDIFVSPGETGALAYRGPEGPRKLPRIAQDAVQGRVLAVNVTSKALGEVRRLTVYTPPGFDQAKRYPVVYAADGVFRLRDAEYLEPLITSGQVPPFVMIGLWPGIDAKDLDYRSREYLTGWPNGAADFRKHERFFLEEVIPLAESRYGASSRPEDRLLTGYSSGASWAVTTGVRHPEMFRKVAAFSLGWRGATAGVDKPGRPAIYLSTGTVEPRFHTASRILVEQARKSGDELIFKEPVTGHSNIHWDPALADALIWAFGKR